MKKVAISISVLALIAGGAIAIQGVKNPACTGVLLEVSGVEQCVTSQEYADLKTELSNEYSREKDYDFDINYIPLIEAVYDYEAKQGNLEIEGADKQQLKNKFIDIL